MIEKRRGRELVHKTTHTSEDDEGYARRRSMDEIDPKAFTVIEFKNALRLTGLKATNSKTELNN